MYFSVLFDCISELLLYFLDYVFWFLPGNHDITQNIYQRFSFRRVRLLWLNRWCTLPSVISVYVRLLHFGSKGTYPYTIGYRSQWTDPPDVIGRLCPGLVAFEKADPVASRYTSYANRATRCAFKTLYVGPGSDYGYPPCGPLPSCKPPPRT